MGRPRILAYGAALIPVAIGVVLVSRYAFNTSDTAVDGVANAFLFGMIAAGAFAGPAIALAVGNRGHRCAAAVLGLLALAAIIVNWTHTLGAISQRGARTEAQTHKVKAAEKDAQAELERIRAERAALRFTPTTAEAVSAAKTAVAAAERARIAECGNGDPKQRGPHCRTRELAEESKRDTLTTAENNKAATDQAARLDAAAAAIRSNLAKTEPTKSTNSLGEMLASLLPLSAVTAASAQQALVSGIAELLIAAALALPELLIGTPVPTAGKPGEPISAEPAIEIPTVAAPAPTLPDVDTVGRFMLACLIKAPGEETAARAIYGRYRQWCSEQSLTVLGVAYFAEQFAARCKRHGIATRKVGDAIVCVGVQLTSPRQALGHMHHPQVG